MALTKTQFEDSIREFADDSYHKFKAFPKDEEECSVMWANVFFNYFGGVEEAKDKFKEQYLTALLNKTISKEFENIIMQFVGKIGLKLKPVYDYGNSGASSIQVIGFFVDTILKWINIYS